MKWFTVLLAIGAIVATERVIKVAKPSRHIANSAARVQYPLWVLLAINGFWNVSWLIGLYGMAIGLVALKQARLIREKFELVQDGLKVIEEIKKSRRIAAEVIREINYLKTHGCPAGWDCRQMGLTGKRCANFAKCSALKGL